MIIATSYCGRPARKIENGDYLLPEAAGVKALSDGLSDSGISE
jgi:hypothetical protein